MRPLNVAISAFPPALATQDEDERGNDKREMSKYPTSISFADKIRTDDELRI
ncbi:MAG: hypothetical protein ABR555_12245 [Pyrinomonadaceae bacterium]